MTKNLSQESENEINKIISENTIKAKNIEKEYYKEDDNSNNDISNAETKVNIEEKEKKEVFKDNVDNKTQEIEKEARLRGWRPKEEYDGDVSKWRSAEEFLEVGKIFDQQKSTKLERELNLVQEQMRQVLEINKKQAERIAREKAEYLEIARMQAIQEANVDQVNKIDSQLNNVKQEIESYKETPKFDPRALEFKERNKEWFNSDNIDNKYLTEYALEYEKELARSKPYLTVEQRLDLVEKEIKSSSVYNFKFGNKNRDKPTKVTLNSPENSSIKKNSKKTFNDLPTELKRTVNNIYSRMGNIGISKDEYAQQLFESGVVTNE